MEKKKKKKLALACFYDGFSLCFDADPDLDADINVCKLEAALAFICSAVIDAVTTM